MKSYRYTLITLVFATCLYVITISLELDLFEKILELLHELEVFEVDEFILPLLIVLAGIFCDTIIRSNKKQVYLEKQKERIDVFQATMRTVQDIVGNFLNNLLLFVMEVENSQALDEETIEELTNLIYETSEQLNKLADFKTIIENDDNNKLRRIDMKKSH